MKLRIDELKKTYETCMKTGNIKEKQPDKELIRSIREVALQGIAFIKDKTKYISTDSKEWTFVFRQYYESLRGLIESFLLFEGISADSHQCKNAYLCYNHQELLLH